MLWVGLAPILAATNLASGLLIGPAAIALAAMKRLTRETLLVLTALSLVSILFYFWGYHSPAGHPSPLRALLRVGNIFLYVLALLGASWHFFSIASISLVCLAGSVTAAVYCQKRVSNFEWFCIAECGLMLATASLTACGRLQYGIAQAAESRYQTVAVIYWAALFSLVLIAVWRWQPARIGLLQMAIVLIAASTLLSLPPLWSGFVAQSDRNRQACASVIHGNYAGSALKQLDFFADDPSEVRRGATVLRERWAH